MENITDKAVAYLRANGPSRTLNEYERQAQVIAAYALEAGFEVVSSYQDNVRETTSCAEYTKFSQMVADLLYNGGRTVIIERIESLAPSSAVQELLVAYLASKEIALHVAIPGKDVTAAMKEDPTRAHLIQVQLGFAVLERALVAQDLRKSRDRKRAITGKCGGRYGYKENPEGAYILKRICALRQNETGQGRLKWQYVAEALNIEGLKTMTGKRWTPAIAQVTYSRYNWGKRSGDMG